jgi:hypothetical protein
MESQKSEDLETFLFKFKEKYSFINIRTQVKWCLLMAYCKEQKLEYERAATNYNQIVLTLEKHPKIMTIELGDIYHRLGICYYHIG